MNSTQKFSSRVENYVLYRPHYPKEVICFLNTQIKLNSQWVIADVGSGTGISSEIFIENGNKVYGIEPNEKMRSAAEIKFQKNLNFISVHGTAEKTTLHNQSVDLIVTGQAFHWFDQKLCKPEFHRILRDHGFILLMWNERNLNSPFQKAYEKIIQEYAPAYADEVYQNINISKIKAFFSPQTYYLHSIPHVQYFDFEGLKGRLLSCSYAPTENESTYKPLMKKLHEIYQEFEEKGSVKFEYHCKLFYGKK